MQAPAVGLDAGACHQRACSTRRSARPLCALASTERSGRRATC